MTNWNLENFDNIYASLAESAYTGRPNTFVYEKLSSKKRAQLDSGQSAQFDFSKDAKDPDGQVTQGASGDGYPKKSDPDAKKTELYLQPDKTLHEEKVTDTYRTPKVNGGYDEVTYETGETYQKGLLTDEKAGFNAYYVSDTEKIDSTTRNTYFVVRGSDGMSPKNYNDWVENDAEFALNDTYIPQAKLANKAMKEKIAELKEKAPDAKMNVTGHSLGTIVSAQAVANLSYDELNSIEKVVLFDGPDVSDSLKKMGLSDKKIKEAGSKVEYYVNPFDIVSMLNRDKPWKEQFGKVNVIVPSKYTGTFEDGQSSHDFGAFQIDSHGQPLVASKKYHPELLKAGQDLAKLDAEILKHLKDPSLLQQVMTNLASGGDAAALGALLTISIAEAVDYINRYKEIIETAHEEGIKWSRKNIGSFHDKIKNASDYNDQILLRTQLLYMATDLATEDVTNMVDAAKKHISEAKTDVKDTSDAAMLFSSLAGLHLSQGEIDELTNPIKLSNVWDDGVEEADNSALDTFKSQLETFGSDLIFAAQNIEAVDHQQAGDIFANLAQ